MSRPPPLQSEEVREALRINSGGRPVRNGLIDRRIFENYIGSFATEFQGVFLAGAGDRLLNDPPDFGRARKGNLVDIRMIDDRSDGR